MTRQRDSRGTWRVNSNHHYLVTLDRLPNTYYGNPRFEATIINIDIEDVYIGSQVYRFEGHYMGDAQEAEWIVKYHEDKVKKMRGC